MTTQIKHLFAENIDRYINPAVVVTELEQDQIRQEIDEYIFTPELTKGLYKFLNALVNKKEGKTGIWISGYYGSGKSHFIKYIYYCIQPEYREKAFSKFAESVDKLEDLEMDVTPANVQSIKRKLDTSNTETILFNIDAISKTHRGTNTITEVFFHKLNEHRGYNSQNVALALYLEKPLDKAGKFEEFKSKIKETFKKDWKGNQQNLSFTSLSTVLDIAAELEPSIDKQSLRSIINNRRQDYTIDELVIELNDFLADKDEQYRLLFLVDEISQYIGDNQNLLLNLETIVEEIGAKCKNQVWLGCTAQQELPKVISNTGNRQGAFGKIMGRFETQVPLESMDASKITKHRLLEKNSEGEKVLNDFFSNHQVEIQNQFVTEGDLYKNYEDKEDFKLTYPFIPYQFQLISDVFQSFSALDYVNEEVKNTERSIIGITHFTARRCKEEEVGYFVPFDAYLNDSFRERLKNNSLNILKRALDITEKDPFAQRVVKILFMVSNLVDSLAVAFPATAENVALLLIQDINDSRSELQQQVEEVLEHLEKQNIIQQKNGVYKFFKEDEIEIANRIENEIKLLLEDQWSYFYDHVINPVVSPDSKYSFGNNVFKATIRIDEKEIFSKGDFDIEFKLLSDNHDLPQLAHEIPKKELGIGLFEWFKAHKAFKEKLTQFVKTQKYVSDHIQGTSGQTRITLNEFQETNNNLLEKIRSIFKEKFLQTPVISAQQVYPPEAFNSHNPKERMKEMVNKHLSNIYYKNKLVEKYADSNQALLKSAENTQLSINDDLTPAESQVDSQLNVLGEGVQLSDVVNRFEKQPYGWNPLSTIDVMIHLAQKGRRQFEYNNEELDAKRFANLALNRRERSSITAFKRKEIDPQKIKAFIEAVNDDIFLKQVVLPGREPKSVVDAFKNEASRLATHLNSLKQTYRDYPFAKHLDEFYDKLTALINKRDTEGVVDLLLQEKNELKDLRDTNGLIDEFTDNQFSQYKLIRKFCRENKQNFSHLDQENQKKTQDIQHFAFDDDKPWESFPRFIKAHKELRKAINERVKNKQSLVQDIWANIYDTIEERQEELSIKDNILPSRQFHLDKISKTHDLTQLELMRHDAEEFKNEWLQKLEDEKAREDEKEGKTYTKSTNIHLAKEMEPRTIESEQQLNEYLDELREHLVNKLNKHKKLYLN